MTNTKTFSKYKALLVSIVLFIVLDLCVLGVNFMLSYNITEDAKSINLAGRQRMLTQRMTKSLLEFQSAHRDFEYYDHIVTDLNYTLNLFDSTFNAFDKGGVAPGTENEVITLKAVENDEARLAIEKAKPIWATYKNYTLDLLNEFEGKKQIKADVVSTFQEESLFETATDFASANSLKLLDLMGDLSNALESKANKLAKLLRTILVVGLCLALLNFLFIMFHTLRQLRNRDEKVNETKKETDRILNTVEEGLFLLDNKLKIGEQYSAAMENIFSTKSIANQPFLSLIHNAINQQDINNAEIFIKLLFDDTKSHFLLKDLNPLKNIPIYIRSAEGSLDLKFLKFTFKPLSKNEHIDHVLVSVSDITEPSLLKKHLKDERRRSELRMNIMTDVLTIDKNVLPHFVNNSLENLKNINTILKQSDMSDRNKINSITPLINNIKTEANTFKLESFSSMTNELNQALESIKNKPETSGKDFTKLTVMLNQMISNVEAACRLPDIDKPTTEI